VELEAGHRELAATRDLTIRALSSLAETRDNETGLHIVRTQHYVKLLAESLQLHPDFAEILQPAFIDLLYKSAPLHDVGKIGIPDHILLKPGKLNEDEFAVMRTHAQLGRDALASAAKENPASAFLRLAQEIALYHHEKWDGTGYPAMLSGEAIPLSARLMALADVYDALVSKRIYKAAMSHEQAKAIIVEGRGTHFDPRVVDAFLTVESGFVHIAKKYGD
ncbi:MAG: HD-GYP domain-containing protein, partial [Granulosicoccaceae bacterium]